MLLTESRALDILNHYSFSPDAIGSPANAPHGTGTAFKRQLLPETEQRQLAARRCSSGHLLHLMKVYEVLWLS